MSQSTPKPVYVIYGADEFLRDQHRAAVVEEVLGDADPQVCMAVHDDSASLADVLDDLRTLPFLADRRLVVVENADGFVSSHRGALETYLEQPAAHGSLLLMLRSKPNAKERLLKVYKKIGTIFDCSSPDAANAAPLIRKRADQLGRQIERQAVDMLLEWIGPDLARCEGELQKLALYTEGRSSITADDVTKVVVATAGVSPWALNNAIAEGDARSALETLSALLTRRGEEYMTLGLIGSHIRKVYKVRSMLDAGRREGDAFRAAKVFGLGERRFRRHLSRRAAWQIQQDFRRVLRTDLAIKTGRDPAAALQKLVVELCQ